MILGRLVRRAGLVAVLAVLAVPSAASATWTDTTLTTNTHLDEPALAIDRDGVSHLVYVGYGDDSGIFVATDAGGTWVSTRLTSAFDDAPAIALDADGHDHVVFVRSGTDAGIYYATDRDGDWAVTRLSDEPADSPSIAVDASGHVRVAFASGSFDPGIIAMDDVGGTWARTQVTRAHLDSATSIVVLPDGSSKIAFARYAPEAPGIYVASAPAGGAWTVDRLTSAYDDDPSMVVRSPDAVDLAFVRFQATGRGLYHASGTAEAAGGGTSSWTVTPVDADSARYLQRPSMAVGGDGLAAIVYSLTDAAGDPIGLARARQRSDGTWSADTPVTPYGNADDWASVATDPEGGIHVAFAELDAGPNPGIYIEAADRFTRVAGSTVDSDVSMAEIGDDHVIAYQHVSTDGQREIRYGRETGGIWAYETASNDPSAPSVVVDDARHARIFAGDAELSDATGAWARSGLGLGASGVRAARDPAGHAWLAFQGADGTPSIASDRSGAWQDASDYYGYPGTGSVAVAADGRIHWVIAGDTLIYQTSMTLDGPWSQRTLGAHAADPTVLVDAAGKVHIAWRRTGADEGTYYTTNRSGAWVTTRLTRSSAEGAASLAVDDDGNVSVAVVRASWAASPGLYLVSDRTGRWVTTRIDGDFNDMDPQLAIDASGRATIVLGRLDAGLHQITEGGPAPSSTGTRSQIREVDVGYGRPAGHGAAQTTSSGPATVPHEHGTEPTP